jgi:predicted nucleic acid-binding Zn ribbon protein
MSCIVAGCASLETGGEAKLNKKEKPRVTDVRYCIACRALLPKDASVCSECGAEQVSRERTTVRMKRKTLNERRSAALAVLIMGILAVVVLFLPFYSVGLRVSSSGFDLALGAINIDQYRANLSVSYPIIWFILGGVGFAAILGLTGIASSATGETTSRSFRSAGVLTILSGNLALIASLIAYIQIQTDASNLKLAPAFGPGFPGLAIFGEMVIGVVIIILGRRMWYS